MERETLERLYDYCSSRHSPAPPLAASLGDIFNFVYIHGSECCLLVARTENSAKEWHPGHQGTKAYSHIVTFTHTSFPLLIVTPISSPLHQWTMQEAGECAEGGRLSTPPPLVH